MKTVYIVRHAKSSWDDPDLPDIQRPLLEKGKKRTKKVIDSLLKKKITINYIISSHAVRSLETAKILARALKYPEDEIRVDSNLYHTDGDGIFNHFYDLPDRFKSVMIIGHNPALTDFVNLFLNRKIDNLPTSGVVGITFNTDKWEEAPIAQRKVKFIIFPKSLSKKD